MKRSKHKRNSSKQQKLSFATEGHSVRAVKAAIKFLSEANSLGARKDQITQNLVVIQDAGAAKSLSSENIIALVDLVGSQKCSHQINNALVECLLNLKQDVPEDALINVVSWLCTHQLHLKLQVGFLKWLIQVYNAKVHKRFSCLFGAIFNFTEYDSIALYACQLLCQITQKYQVVPFRVRRLQAVMSKMGPQHHILALFGVFAHHRPDLITVKISSKIHFGSLFAFDFVQDKEESRQLEENHRKKKKSECSEMMLSEEVSTFPRFCDAVQNLKNPKGLEKLLTSPTRRILFTSGLPTSLLSQFCSWLHHSLATEKPLKKNSLWADRGELLTLACDISEELQEGIPEVEDFVKAYITRWNGHSHLDHILDVLQYWRFCTFNSLLEDILLPIFKYFSASSVAYKCSVLECYTNLYQHWALKEVPCHESCRDGTTNSIAQKLDQKTLFGQEFISEDPYQEVQSLASYIDSMCIAALRLHPEHPPVLLYQIMTFFEVVIETHSVNCAAPLVLPSPFIISAAIFSSAPAVSQLCGLITSYKKAVDSLKAKDIPIQESVINTLNLYLLDICNILWRCCAFEPEKAPESLLFQKKVPADVQQSITCLGDSFSLYHHPAFFKLALDFVHELDSEVELSDLLHGDVRIRDAYLTYLSDSGLKNVTTFIQTFIRQRTSTEAQERE